MLRVFVFSLFASISTVAADQAVPAPPSMPGQLVTVRGHRVHIDCIGQGSPTVVVASGGFSFDWGLVQPQIAQLTRICTYDPAGTAWSDPSPTQTTPYGTGRVDELHQLLVNAGVPGPYVLVGYSIGGLITRLYAARYLPEVAGMVFVDHAFIDTPNGSASKTTPSSLDGADSPPQLISQSPITLDLEDDQNFSKLPVRNQQLHKWALLHSLRPTPEMAAECFTEVERAEQGRALPLEGKPVAVVSTLYDSPAYKKLQEQLLMLSTNSKQYIAENSSHMVIIDQPGIVLQAIQEVIAATKRLTVNQHQQ